jgi:DNA-binding transcriptional LysR family regulator
MNRRWRDHVPVVGLDHLAGADQVAGPGLAPVREPVALAGRGGGQDAGGLPAGGHAVQADPGHTVVALVAAGGGRGLLPGRARHHRVMHLRWVAVVAGDHLADSEHLQVPGSSPAARKQVQGTAASRRSCGAVITS